MSELTAIESATSLLAVMPNPRGCADPYRAYLDSLDSDESKKTMGGCLDRIARIVLETESGAPLPHDHPPVSGAGRSWWVLRYDHTMRIRAKLMELGYSPGTVNKHLVALRRVLEECWNLELMTAEEYHRARKIKSVKFAREKSGQSLHESALPAMVAFCRTLEGPRAVRNAALIGVLYSTGCRREEMADVLIERYSPGERALKIVGKGNKERMVYIHPDVVPLLDEWLLFVAERKGPLFRPIDRYWHIRPKAMTKRAVGLIVDITRRGAGQPLLSTHDFRHDFIGRLLDAGADLATVQELVGHASPVTTAGYDPRPGATRRAAVDKLTIPNLGSADFPGQTTT